jgi:DMSO/TMAO reductase YedYZ molybdopterin-dependent catalytic subunit
VSATRREFLAVPAAAFATLFWTSVAATVQHADGRLLGVVPVGRRDRRSPPLETPLSSGANLRLFTDLSTLSKQTLVPESRRFFVRTGCPEAVPAAAAWSLEIGGLVDRARSLPLAELRRLMRPVGTHLIECAGNGDPTNFGLMCTAQWEGVPIEVLLDRVRPQSQARRVLVSGIDFSEPTPTSVPGASWIFTRDELEKSAAFLALQMNSEPLGRDHGLPARLVVPGWYGCASIKWVNQIAFVDDGADATPQMREYAVRTHQSPALTLARDFQPARIDHAATVVRVEKWLVGNRLEYRVVGLLWGGSRPTNALQIRFNRDEPFERVDDCPLPPSTTTWSLWSHVWRPRAPGWYQIALRIADPAIRTRRLDRNFYARDVDIAEV